VNITREVLVRHYVRGESVAAIAAALAIPEGTVKSRLDAGRRQVRKGLETMEEKKDYLPGRLHIWNSGASGPKGEPQSLVEGDLIVQNVLMVAYDKPLTAAEIARRIGIPTVYIEPILGKLADAELMIRTEGGKYAADFIIYKPEDSIARLQPQLDFVRSHFERIWKIAEKMFSAVREMPEVREMPAHVRTKLERYAVLEALQQFELYKNGVGKDYRFNHKKRPDGGAWAAFGFMYPMGYSSPASDEVGKYSICGGRRTSGGKCDFEGAKYLRLCEFDTNLWDSPHRFAGCGFDAYFEAMPSLLWCAYRGIEPTVPFPDVLMESIPQYCKLGLLTKEDGTLRPDIPILNRDAFARFSEIISSATEEVDARIGEVFRTFLRGTALAVPPHLAHVQLPYLLKCSTQCFAMGVVREAYDRGLHLAGVDYCCPPVILEYEE